jgi:hypothetical protein
LRFGIVLIWNRSDLESFYLGKSSSPYRDDVTADTGKTARYQTAGYGLGGGGGGVSVSGGRGFGGGRTAPGTGRTSIGGGSGATCWLITGAAAAALGFGGATGGRGATSFGLGGTSRGSRAGVGNSKGV